MACPTFSLVGAAAGRTGHPAGSCTFQTDFTSGYTPCYVALHADHDPFPWIVKSSQGRSSDSFPSRRLPGRATASGKRLSGLVVPSSMAGTYSRGNCCLLSRHSLLIGGGLRGPLRTFAQQKYKKFGFARPYNEKRSPYGDLSEPKPGLEPGTSSLRVKRSTN